MIHTQKVGGILRNGIVLKQNPHPVSAIKSNSSTQRKAPYEFINEQDGRSPLIYKWVEWTTFAQHLHAPAPGERGSFFPIFSAISVLNSPYKKR